MLWTDTAARSIPAMLCAVLLGTAPHTALQTASPSRDAPVTVPFVGCESDGQVGPHQAPMGDAKELRMNAKTASQLAFFKAEPGVGGVLGPRGWSCVGLYGSNGSILFVTPRPMRAKDLLRGDAGPIDGPALQLTMSEGATSGRFAVARMIARVFPAERAYVQRVIQEGIRPASDFPFGPYPQDRLTYRGERVVEYETPARTEGLGSHSRLRANADPIRGVAILEGDNLLHLAVRLPNNLNALASLIIEQFERDNVDPRGGAGR